jgi:hypothetical protein
MWLFPWVGTQWTQVQIAPVKMRSRARNLFGFTLLLAVALGFSAGARDFTPSNDHRAAVDDRILTESAKRPVQTSVVRTTGGVDTRGWILIAILHGPDAELVHEGQQVRAFSVNSRTRLHLARVTRVIKQQDGVRVEATLAARVLGISTRYLMEIVIEST